MNIIFMGTPDFAVPGLEKLANNPQIEVKAVVTQPDRPRGRGQKVQFSPVKQNALDLNLQILQTKDVNQTFFLEKLVEYQPDIIVVVAFGQKLSKELLALPKLGCINLHASLLPRYRGASPIHQAIIDGLSVSGVSTMYMDEGWDTGDIIYQQKVNITSRDTVGSLHDKLAQIGADLLVKTVLDLKAGTAPRDKQNNAIATYAAKIHKETGQIDWSETAEDIFNLVRGVNPWPGAYTYHQGNLLKIWQVTPLNEDKEIEAEPGEVVIVTEEKGLVVKTGKGLIKIDKLQLAGRKKMPVRDFLRGYTIKKGQKLSKG